MRLASFLLDELDPRDLRPGSQGAFVNGRSLVTRWITERIIAHTAIKEFAVCGVEAPPVAGATVLPFGMIDSWLTEGKSVWFEPARHYWWRPALLRQVTGQSFPIVSMIHSLGYGVQFQPLMLSLAARAGPGDTVIAPSMHAANVFRHHSEAILQLLGQDRPVPHTTVIPYGVPPVPQLGREAARALLGWDTTPVILFVGRLSYQDKADFDALFEAIARLAVKGHSLRLVLAGSDREQQSEVLRARAAIYGISAMVEPMPNISDIDKHVLLSACDLFVSPSNTVSESFGLSLIEAMLHGCPIICTAWSGYKEIIRDGIDGVLVNTWWNESHELDLAHVLADADSLSAQVAIDIPHLTSALEELLQSPEKRRALGQAAKAHAQAHYIIDHAIEKIIAALHQAAEACDYERTTPQNLAFASVLGSYANSIWSGEERLQAEQGLELQRLLRAGSPQDLMHLKSDCLNHQRPGSKDERFRLLRRGMARVVAEQE